MNKEMNDLVNQLKESVSPLIEVNEAKTLEDWRETIEENVEFVDVKPYSHNIINIALQAIAKDYGKNEANQAIVDFGLEDLGWSQVK